MFRFRVAFVLFCLVYTIVGWHNMCSRVYAQHSLFPFQFHFCALCQLSGHYIFSQLSFIIFINHFVNAFGIGLCVCVCVCICVCFCSVCFDHSMTHGNVYCSLMCMKVMWGEGGIQRSAQYLHRILSIDPGWTSFWRRTCNLLHEYTTFIALETITTTTYMLRNSSQSFFVSSLINN